MEKILRAMLSLSLIALAPLPFTGEADRQTGDAFAADTSKRTASGDEHIPLSFTSVVGNWRLKYSGNYGYAFSLYANYRALVVLYLNMETLFFKGVYTIEEGNKLKINIYEMKEEHRSGRRSKGYVRAQSSYFLFGGHKVRKNKKETLYLRPLAIVIDGNNSEGYFEPLIKLAKTR
ncbi:MAG: hypothetical protein JW807_02020 [Spirochaetes bacterium]|nr:hypothetical protein [Spirochaetota bacterium]